MAAESSLRCPFPLRSTLDPLRSGLRFRFRVTMEMQFEKIVGSADQLPLAGDFVEASQSEPANAAPFFDLSKDGFDDRFSHSVFLFAGVRCQSLAHPLSLGAIRCIAGQRFAGRFGVGSNQHFDSLQGFIVEAVAVPVSTVRGDGRGDGAGRFADRFRHGDQLLLVVDLLGDFGGDDHLGVGVGGGLRVVSLDERHLVAAIRHDPRFRVHKVVLAGR